MSEPVDHNKNESTAPRHPFIEKAVLVLVLLSLGTLAYGGHRVGWNPMLCAPTKFFRLGNKLWVAFNAN